MDLDKEIARQIDRINGLERDILTRKASAADAKLPAEMRRARAGTLRKAIADLRKRREEVTARFDKEIAGYEAELKALETGPDVDIGGLRGGGTGGGGIRGGDLRRAAADTDDGTLGSQTRKPRKK
ncbi:hypothetical protein [Alloyangia pacifica]|uniref:Uncharacterized protein n=1 Tax=Alloyangia pacifica TaxID=311180 RepID=A0A1I6PRJ8_9RHOB|nr:hypothetical protein [Alloyangia pacifica]SDG33867.1 hypothetical protein SAMN04488245_102419 [Alloyangia pacifica]SFS42829.1 hypothetical protein SAMN04488050_101720 [Alloyangia pacifica]